MPLALNPYLVQPGAGLCPPVRSHLLGTGTGAFASGDLIYLNSGVVTTVGDDALTARTVAGFALEADHASTATEVRFMEIHPDQVWAIRCSSAATLGFASAFTEGTRYALIEAADLWYADAAVSDQDMIIYLGPLVRPGEASDGSASNWGLFRFIEIRCQLDYGDGV